MSGPGAPLIGDYSDLYLTVYTTSSSYSGPKTKKYVALSID